MVTNYFLAVVGDIKNIKTEDVAKWLLRTRLIDTYVVVPDNGLFFRSPYGTYFLTDKITPLLEGATYLFSPFFVENFGGNLPQATWDDLEKTFTGSMDRLLETHDDNKKRREQDEAAFNGEQLAQTH